MIEDLKEDYKAWMDQYGMLNPEKNKRSENGILFSLEYFLMDDGVYNFLYFKRLTNRLVNSDFEGLYEQTPFDMRDFDGELEPMSRDNLIAVAGGLHYYGYDGRVRAIWEYLKHHKFTYDSTMPGEVNLDRAMRPWEFLYIGAMAGSILCKLCLPWVVLLNIISCASPYGETSGKLLVWVKNTCYANSWVMRLGARINEWQINRKYKQGWADVFKIYFHQKDNPIANKAYKLYSKEFVK